MPFTNTYTTFDDVECGLVAINKGYVLPFYLEKCQVSVEVVNHLGHYTVKQTYVNLTDESVEALYIFPIQEGGTVHFFKAESNGKVVESVIKEKGGDVPEIDEDELAVEDDRTAFLISEFKPDIYQLAVGELGANSVTEIELRYVCELPIDENTVKLTIPNTVAPQYTMPAEECEEKTKASVLVDIEKDIDIEISVRVRQTIAFKLTSEPTEIEFVDGETIDEDGFFFSTGTLSVKRTAFDEDQIVRVSTLSEKSFGARILIEETSKGEVAAMVTIVPEFPTIDFQAEMIFLVDRSGSMMGRSIEKAKEALHIFLASLPADCKFNICSFNASFDFLFESAQPYNDETLQSAREYADNMRAGGGTRVYEPLEKIFKQPIEDGCQRQIFVLTDGQVSRPQESISMVAKYTKQGRVFGLGIGEDASRELVNGLARSGNGAALFVTLAEDLKDKVLELLSSSLLPVLSNITMDWLSDMKPQKKFLSFFNSGNEDVGTKVTLKEPSVPKPIPHCFSTQLCIVYQSLEFGALPVGLRISGTGPKGDVMLLVNLDTTKVMKSDLVHKLMARRMVKVLEEDDSAETQEMQQRMTDLGTKYNVVNKWCANTTTAQFGEVKSAKSTVGPGVPATESAPMFQPAPPGIVQANSCPPPLLFSSNSAPKKAKGMKASKQSSMFMKNAPMQKSYGGGSGSERYQVSNTRMAKSKYSSYNSYAMPNMMMQSQQDAMVLQAGGGGSSSNYKTKSAMRDDMLMGFTLLQKTDGSYSYGPAFSSDLNMTEADIEAGAVEFGVQKDLFMTLIVIIYLRSVMANRQSSWIRMGEKADGFIASNIGDKDLARLEEDCEKFIDRYILASRSKVLFKGYKKGKK